MTSLMRQVFTWPAREIQLTLASIVFLLGLLAIYTGVPTDRQHYLCRRYVWSWRLVRRRVGG